MSNLITHDKCLYHDRRRKMFYLSYKLVEFLHNPDAVAFLMQGKDIYISEADIFNRKYFLNRKGHEKRYCFRSSMLTKDFNQNCEKVYYLLSGEKILIAEKVWHKLVITEAYL